MSDRCLVYGAGIAGLAVARALLQRDFDVVMIDDEVTESKASAAARIGCDLLGHPSDAELRALVESCDFLAPSPGVSEDHPVMAMARASGVPLRSELDLAYEWELIRPSGARAAVAVTGTDGKTTTVSMVEAILKSAGHRPIACGNTEIPFVEAVDSDADAFVIEATSFRLACVESFRTPASAWLNFAPDHLDWHRSLETYEAAKAKLWGQVRPSDSAIGWTEDPIVMKHLGVANCHQVTFGSKQGDYRQDEGVLVGPRGGILPVAEMSRSLPHDVTNALAASALSIESGLAEPSAAGDALRHFVPPKHRIEFVTERDAVRYFDDSKATTPHAAVTAIRSFDSIVLIAGGRNKDLDLSEMATESERLRACVLIGESSDELANVFHGRTRTTTATTMAEAVTLARRLARPGDVVLLSPGCTSLDWYGGYAQRGDDFVRCVLEEIDELQANDMEIMNASRQEKTS